MWMITSWNKKQEFGKDATEHVLTTENPQYEDTLRSRIISMPVSEGFSKGSSTYDSIERQKIIINLLFMKLDPVWTTVRSIW